MPRPMMFWSGQSARSKFMRNWSPAAFSEMMARDPMEQPWIPGVGAGRWCGTLHARILSPRLMSASLPQQWALRPLRPNKKRAKYAQLVSSPDYQFMPVAIETLGVWGPSAIELCREIGSRVANLSGDPRSHAFLIQRLSLAVQRGNAASITGIHPLADLYE